MLAPTRNHPFYAGPLYRANRFGLPDSPYVVSLDGQSLNAIEASTAPFHALERTELVKITVREFLNDILNTNSMHIIVR